jgi:predicted HTH transcriptional regulator
MNTTLMEELLNEDESSTLDFKRDQYPFEKASDEQKSELLKDVLAFANAWRRTDAYILIGVEDVKGGRSNVVGVTSHFDDASIQQFVNGKTNRPVTFSYEVFPFENVQVGIFHLPLQDRPIYLKKDFGKLKQREVYIRRSSSTDTADPDEIAKMGTLKIREVLGELPSQPKLNPVVESLRRDFEEQNIVLAEVAKHTYNIWRMQCKVAEVNDLYAVFQSIGPEGQVSGAIGRITVSYEPMMKMKMYTIAPVV